MVLIEYNEKTIRDKYKKLGPSLNEKSRRLFLGYEAKLLGRGGISLISRATGITRNTIRRGIKDLDDPAVISNNRIRNPGGGRKKLTEKNSGLKSDLKKLIEPLTRGDPESPLCWTALSTRNLETALNKKGHKITHTTIASILRSEGFSLQANRKTKEGIDHPDRNAQFLFISESVEKEIDDSQPVISVDSKKKELVGNFKNGDRELRPKGRPEKVNMHDFPDKELGKVTPHGIYELKPNDGWITLGIDHDTAEFAVSSIRKWWKKSHKKYVNADKLTITADCGGSNGYRNKLWKYELQKFANETGLIIKVHHFPPGTSKWNKIEHKLFSFITKNWRGRPLLSHAMIVNTIASTKTKTGLSVECVLDTGNYPTGKKVAEEEFRKINLKKDKFHGEWNYMIEPQID